MAVIQDYEVYTQNKFTVIATKANLDHATPEVGNAVLIGAGQPGVAVADRTVNGVADDKIVVDVGQNVYWLQVAVTTGLAEGDLIYYNTGTSSAPFLSNVNTDGPLFGAAVLADENDSFPKGAGTQWVAVLVGGGAV